jgi:DNA-directed RNA polymerase subunit K/omega
MDANEIVVPPAPTHRPLIPDVPAPPIHSRFLFVDVSALRAKQLRRGALPRFSPDHAFTAMHKPERVAMEEVRRRLVEYQLPPDRKAVGSPA